MLRLRGAWLLAAGFPNGTRVSVTVEAGRLVLHQVQALKAERVQ
jgi:type I toxin-antitoxin system toxin SymE